MNHGRDYLAVSPRPRDRDGREREETKMEGEGRNLGIGKRNRRFTGDLGIERRKEKCTDGRKSMRN